jgi:hypothetical protein
MKLTKSLFLAFAGLGLFACSNEEIADNGGVQGEANVVVRISTNSSRTASDLSESAALAVQGTAKVYLETALGRLERTITLNGTDQTASFEGVRSPGHIWVSVNGYNTEAESLLPEISLVTANSTTNEGLKAPMFADGGNVSLNSSQWTYDDDSKTYTGTLAPQHQIARLEFAGIKHAQSGDDACIFQSITFDGLFLNGIKLDTKASSSTSFANWAAVTATEQKTMPCFDKIEGGADFLTHGTSAVTYPKEEVGECYAYNIVGGDCPVLTLCFSNISLVDPDSYWPTGKLGYATVSKYKAKGSDIKGHEKDFGATAVSDESAYYEITKFPAGYIYQVTSLPIEDKNIGTTIDGEPVNVVATVQIVDWKLVNGQVEWTE